MLHGFMTLTAEFSSCSILHDLASFFEFKNDTLQIHLNLGGRFPNKVVPLRSHRRCYCQLQLGSKMRHAATSFGVQIFLLEISKMHLFLLIGAT